MFSGYRDCISRACAMAAFAAVVAAAAVPGWAQSYPSQPVELVVGYPQSGAGDIIARLIADRLGNVLGQPVHAENRPGASGAIAAQTVAHAAPDGHTLLAGQTPEVAIIPTLVEMPRHRSQTRLTHVPFEGAGPALEALTDGRVDFCFSPLPVAMPYVTSGKLKRLALSLAKRSLAMPNVPTVMEETSAKGFDVTNWVGIFAPRGTSKPIVTRLNREMNQTLAEPNIRERLVNDGADITPMSADQFAGFVESEIGKYERLLVEEFCSRFWYGGCVSFPPF
jgi:tripartite-type tricarboxylate transporter receptor subunit TctC